MTRKLQNIRAVVEMKMAVKRHIVSKTQVEMERHCQEGPESLEHQGGMGQ